MKKLIRIAPYLLPGLFAGAAAGYYTNKQPDPVTLTAKAELEALRNMCALEPTEAKRTMCEYVADHGGDEKLMVWRSNYNQAYQGMYARAPNEDEMKSFTLSCAFAQMLAGMMEDMNSGKATPEKLADYGRYSVSLEIDLKAATAAAGLDYYNDEHIAMLGITAEQMPHFRRMMEPVILPPSLLPEPQPTPRPVV